MPGSAVPHPFRLIECTGSDGSQARHGRGSLHKPNQTPFPLPPSLSVDAYLPWGMRLPFVLLLILPLFGQGVPLPDSVVLVPNDPNTTPSPTSQDVTLPGTAPASAPVTTQTKTITPMQRIIVAGGVGLAYVASRKITQAKAEKAAKAERKAAGNKEELITKEKGLLGSMKVLFHPSLKGKDRWKEWLLRGWRRQVTPVRAPLDPLAA